MPGYVTDYDDSCDSTYAMFIFDVPEEWKEDVDKVKDNKMPETSKAYQRKILEVMPKLKDKLPEDWAK